MISSKELSWGKSLSNTLKRSSISCFSDELSWKLDDDPKAMAATAGYENAGKSPGFFTG